MLQTPEDRKRIKGIIINKFRGDLRLFEEGKKLLEEICGIPVLGVVPMFRDIYIEEEDSVELAKKCTTTSGSKTNVAVVMLRHISNFTDFAMLERDERLNLFYTNNVEDLQKADIIILPGTKSTLDDLYELRRNGVAQAIVRAHRNGTTVLGICGGYQMLGQTVADPDGVEGSVPQLPGLGLLPVSTTMKGEKTTRQVEFAFHNGKEWSCQNCKGYEIHQGETAINKEEAFCLLADGQYEGCRQGDHCMGTYIHGILDNPQFIEYLLSTIKKEQKPAALTSEAVTSIEEFKNQQYDKLANHVRQFVDINKLYEILC